MMNIENVYNKFEEIKNVSGSISKKVLLRQNSTDEDFIYVLEFIYNPFKKTGIANKKLDKNINATIKIGQKSRFPLVNSDNLAYTHSIHIFLSKKRGFVSWN